eukprot:92646-Rhodomonas_salina.1
MESDPGIYNMSRRTHQRWYRKHKRLHDGSIAALTLDQHRTPHIAWHIRLEVNASSPGLIAS